MRKPDPIPKLDPQVEEEIDKKNLEEDKKVFQEPKNNMDSIEINTVNLSTVVEFERKEKIKNEEIKEDGKEEGGDITRGNEGERKTPLSGRTDKRKSRLIY